MAISVKEIETLSANLSSTANATHFDGSTQAARIIRLANEILLHTQLKGPSEEDATLDCLSVLAASVNTRWRYLDNETGTALKGICTKACKLLSSGLLRSASVATKFIQKMSEIVTESLLLTPGIDEAILWLLSRGIPHRYVLIGAKILCQVVSKALGVTVTPCGTVVGLQKGSRQGEVVRMYWSSSLADIISEQLIVRVCRILSDIGKRCTMADINLGCRCIGVIAMLLNDDAYQKVFPNLLSVLGKERMLFLVLRLTKMAYRLPSPLFLQGANDLLWRYCGADKEKHKELYSLVFESEIQFVESRAETREAVVECLFWINAFNYPTCQSSDIVHAMSWVRKYRFLERLNRYLSRVCWDADYNWFLLCANTYSNAFHPILYKLATSQSEMSIPLRKTFQNEMQESGLLDITQTFIRGLVDLIKLKFKGKNGEMAEEDIVFGYTIALATSNVVYLYTLCMHDNLDVVQYCEVCGALAVIVEALDVSEMVFEASSDADIIRLGARAQEEALGLLCTLMYQKLGRVRVDRWPLDEAYIRDGVFLDIIKLIGRLGPLSLVMLSQRVVLIRKRIELLFYLTHYSTKVISNYYDDMHREIHRGILGVLKSLEPQVDSLLQLKAGGFEGVGPTNARNIEDIDSYHTLLGHVFPELQQDANKMRNGNNEKKNGN